MKQIVVIGAGTMGNGIAHTAAASGFDVTLIDVAEAFLERGMSTISSNLQRGVDKGKMTADEKQQILGRIRSTSDVNAAANADIVIEAILENLGAKTELFAKLDRSPAPIASSRRTRRRSRSRRSPPPRSGPTKSSACTS